MAFVQFSKISLSFGDRDILKDVSINLAEGTKAALTGGNGSGKSTLIKILAGISQADSGNRAVEKNCRIGYLPQSGIVHHGCSLMEEVDKAFDFGHEMQKQIDMLGEQLKLEEQAELIQKLDDSGYHRRQAMCESVLLGLGFEQKDFGRNVEEFSGGWQMRIALAKVLLSNPDILLLDEPTNYLDIEARNWLEQFLADFSGGFLLVSHDRYFLDVTVNEIYELFNGNLNRYPGNYTHYEKVRQVELESLIQRYELQQAEIKKLEDFIRRFGAKATKAAQAQERQKMLDKILENKIEIPENLKKIHFSFPPAPHSGKIVVTGEALNKTWVSIRSDGSEFDNHVIKDLDLLVENGERLVVVGRNGAGKSTLLRIIAGADSDYSGTLKLGAGVQVGYFTQDNAETLKGSMSILELLESEAPLELIPKLRDMLGSFLFRGDDVFKSIDVLSGGEKSRVALLRLLLKPINLLILDEPTNHLDLHSKDVLLDALKDFGGTIIFVSHDRSFIEKLATRVLELHPGVARNFPGNYEYYLSQIEISQSSVQMSNTSKIQSSLKASASTSETQAKTMSANQLNREETKRLAAEKKRLEKREEQILLEIDEAEEQKISLEMQLSLPEVYSDGEKCREISSKIDELETKITELNSEWEELSEKLSSL